jgi:hypothetical protein
MGTTRGYEGAVADCTVALGLEGGNVKALYRRGTALAMLNKWGAAMKGEYIGCHLGMGD